MLTTILLLIIGVILVGVSVNSYLKLSNLLKTGLEAEGIVFDLESSDTGSGLVHFPVIRFLTANNEWITQASQVGLTAGYKKGAKVTVIYQQDKPSQFIIKSFSNYIVPLVLAIAGCSCILWGIGY